MRTTATNLLRWLEQHHLAPTGEHVVDVERAAAPGDEKPVPVLLLTDGALYASRANGKSWERLPLHRVGQVSVCSDPSGMLTRYRVTDTDGDVWFAQALPMARDTFRERMEQLATGETSFRSAEPAPGLPTASALASLASLASARSMASAASMVSAASVTLTPQRAVRVA